MTYSKSKHTGTSGKAVFLNASENKSGNTSAMTKKLLAGRDYQQINLADYNIPQIGQGDGDFDKVYDQLKGASVIVIGMPVYWSNISGYLKTFIDHMAISDDLKGADLYAIVQGASSDQSAAEASAYGSLNRIAMRFGLNFVGIGTNSSDMSEMNKELLG